MKKCLITGVAGFIGSNFAQYLLQTGVEVYGFVNNISPTEELKKSAHIIKQNILDKDGLEENIKAINPDCIFHFAALSSITSSWEAPHNYLNVNVSGTLNLLDAVRCADINPRILITGSSSEYGNTGSSLPVKEDHPLFPANPYAVSKATMGQFARLYHKNYGLNIIYTRPFSVIGAQKKSGVCYDFALRVIEAEKSKTKVMETGNLNVIRDFLNIKDAIKAFSVLAEKGTPGEVYNISSGYGVSIHEVLNKIIKLSGISVTAKTNPVLLRPLDEPVLIGDCTKLRRLGWEPIITLEETLTEILEFAASKV
ncbi:MAG: GDP-mannose 4,6-dehydratase [Dehalococcoidales bacterium]